jgi:hypothetical protein
MAASEHPVNPRILAGFPLALLAIVRARLTNCSSTGDGIAGRKYCPCYICFVRGLLAFRRCNPRPYLALRVEIDTFSADRDMRDTVNVITKYRAPTVEYTSNGVTSSSH